MITENNQLRMPKLEVEVIEESRRVSKNRIACEIGVNLEFSTTRLESYFLASWRPVVFDALLVAAAVEFCDRWQKRPDLGWGRDSSIKIPVHNAAHWQSDAVRRSLIDALQFLTGDRWDIEFVPRRKPQDNPQQNYLEMPIGITTIVPFSDGIDSRAVSTLLEKERGATKIHRVCLGPKGKQRRTKRQDRRPFTTVPYKVSTGKRSGETSARSRGFKFATVSGVAALLVGATEIIVPESGQGALGPVLVPTGHGYEDYRNHPFFTDRMEKYFKALFGADIRFSFPRLWFTKGETLAAFSKVTSKQAHIDARSCWQQSRQVSVNKHRRQCGVCAACMLRRLSVHAAGLSEPEGTDVWEDLGASTFEGGAEKSFDKVTSALREYAVAGTLHLDHLADLKESPLYAAAIKRQARQLALSRRISVVDAEEKLLRLLSQHQTEWRQFVRSLGEKSFIRSWAASVA